MVKLKKADPSQNSPQNPKSSDPILIAQMHAEKCDLKRAQVIFQEVLVKAKSEGDLKTSMEAISGLLRLSTEALDDAAIHLWEKELDMLMREHPQQVPPMAWYCKGALARHHGELFLAQRYFHRYLKAIRAIAPHSDGVMKAWVMIATIYHQKGRTRRAFALAQSLLTRYSSKNYRGLNGNLYLLLGLIHEKRADYGTAQKWYQKAHSQFLGEHNWYYHLYVLYAYARLARLSQDYSQAYWYLDMIAQAVAEPEFGLLRREIGLERARLESASIDLLIDSRHGLIQTREHGSVSLKKQYVLLHILEALSTAHGRTDERYKRGLSKAEIIETVWKEPYRPEAHDNKLYYNINRLRKLIEPDVRKPQYLLSWKEGYRLAPGLRVQHVEDVSIKREREL